MRRPTAFAATACAFALFGGLAGCAPPAAAGLPDGVSVDVLQGRTDYTSGTLVIRVVNESPDDLELSRASLDAAGFAGPAEWERGTTVRAGTTVDLRAAVPEPDCAAETGQPLVTFTLASPGTAVPVTVPADDPLGTLERLHTAACIVERVDRIAGVSVGMPSVEGTGRGAVAVLPLTLEPTGADGHIEIARIASTPLLKPDPDDTAGSTGDWTLSASVDAASGPVIAHLRIVPARCDPHGIAEDKVGTVLVISVTLNDGTTGNYRFVPPDDVRTALLQFVSSACGFA